MIKNVEEALTAISDYYFYELGCSSKNYIYPKEAEEATKRYKEAKKFLYDMEKELNELKHYESVNGQLESFNVLNRK